MIMITLRGVLDAPSHGVSDSDLTLPECMVDDETQ